MVKLEVVDEASKLNALRPEWAALVDRTEHVTPFQTPEWLLTWWQYFGSGRLAIFLFRLQSRLVGIMPCFLHEWHGRRQLTLLGSGISDFPEPVLDKSHFPEIRRLIEHHLASDMRWDICNWQDLSWDTPLRALNTIDGLELVASNDQPCSRILLVGTFEDFWRNRSKELRRNLRRSRERTLRLARPEFEPIEACRPDRVDDLIRLHRDRWRRRGEAGMIEANHSEEFIRASADKLAQCGMLLMFTLRLEGKTAAIIFGFRFRSVFYAYLSAFDPGYETLGVGRTLLYEAIRYAFANRFACWHFLRGDEAYKSSWGAEPIPKCRLILTRKS